MKIFLRHFLGWIMNVEVIHSQVFTTSHEQKNRLHDPQIVKNPP